MLATLDSFIAQDRGGRPLLLFRQLWDLFSHVGSVCGTTQIAMFDSVLATAAQDIDPSIIAELAVEAERLPEGLPAFMALLNGQSVPAQAVASRDALKVAGVIALVEAISGPDTSKLPEEGSAMPGEATAAVLVDLPQAEPGTAAEPNPSSERTERRARSRDPVEDAQNPITLARRANLEELARIAALPNLPESLTNVIVARGDRTILNLALGNHSATFARSSLTTLAELAPSDRMIREALIARHDLPEPIIERLLPFLAVEKRAVVLTNGAQFSEVAAREALRQAQSDLVSAYRGGQMPLGLDSCLAMLDEQKMSMNEIVTALARDVRVAELSAFAAARLGIREVTAFNILSGRIDHGPSVLLRALDCDAQAIDQVMTMRRRLGCRDAKETRSAFMVAQRYTVEGAHELVRSMDQVIELPVATEVDTELSTLPEVDHLAREAA